MQNETDRAKTKTPEAETNSKDEYRCREDDESELQSPVGPGEVSRAMINFLQSPCNNTGLGLRKANNMIAWYNELYPEEARSLFGHDGKGSRYMRKISRAIGDFSMGFSTYNA